MKARVMFVIIAVMAGSVFAPAGFAQRRGGGMVGRVSRPASGFQQRAAPVTDPRNSPTSPIQPMTNPVAPVMNAPVQPFANYLNTPAAPARSFRGQGDGFRGDRGRGDRDVVIVGGGGFYPGFYPGYYPFDPLYYAPLLSPPPIPGQIPYTFPLPLYSPAPIPGQLPNTIPLLPEETVPVVDPVPSPVIESSEPAFFSEPRIIIPMDVVTIRELPALGSSRSDVVTRYGEPWGVVTMKGKETTYVRGGLVVVFENGRAADVQKR